MFTILKTCAIRTSALAAVLTLAACGNLSQINDGGTSQEPVWPDAAQATFDVGAYPSIENLRLIAPGMTKDQLYNLLGRPHFSEGLVGVREWDYLFHFRTPQGDVTCQYKVLFDKDKHAQSFFWKPAACADLLQSRKPDAPKAVSLSGDVLFAFGSATLTQQGLAEVNRVAVSLPRNSDTSILITGHTDFIGSDAANLALSESRAQAVGRQLVTQGVPAAMVRAQGMGEAQPQVQCQHGPRAQLIACLAPNRRVEITVAQRS